MLTLGASAKRLTAAASRQPKRSKSFLISVIVLLVIKLLSCLLCKCYVFGSIEIRAIVFQFIEILDIEISG